MQKPLPAYQGDEPFLFVSYAHANADTVYLEMIWLQERGFNLWYDDGIGVGSDWRQSLARAIAGSAGLVFFADEQSVVSPNCIREINFALDEGKPTYVVQLDDVTFPDALRLSLSDRQILIRSNFEERAFRDRLTAALRREADLEELPAHARRKRSKAWPWWLIGLAIAAGAVLTLVWFTSMLVPSFSNPAQVTSASGVEDYPAWSPSGQMITYQSNEDGNWDIWVRQPGSSEAINRTASHEGHDMFPSWSPDGRSIAYWSDRDGSGYYVMPALSGDPKKLVSLDVDALGSLRYKPIGPPRWSSDAKRLMYTVGTITSRAYGELLSLETGETQRFEMPGRVPGFDPAWSPNDEYVTWVAGWHREYETSAINVRRLTDGATVSITDDHLQHLNPTWVDDEHIVYVVNRGSSRDLWLQALTRDLLPRGAPIRLTTGVGMRQASFSPDRSKLAYSKGRRISNVWRVPILPNRPATWSDAQQVTFDQSWVEFIAISPDGTQLVVSSDRSGNKDLWLMPVEPQAGDLVQLTDTGYPEWGPNWAPDGTTIVYYAFRDGTRSLYSLAAAGGLPEPIDVGDVNETFIASWSPDGSRLAFRGTDVDNNNDIYTLALVDGSVQRLTTDPGVDLFPGWAPDGSVTFVSTRDGDSRIWRLPADGGVPEPLSGPGMNYYDWAPDGRHLYAIGVHARADDIWQLAVTGEERQVTDLVGKRRGHIGTEAFATDGRYLYFTWEDDLGDIWVMDVTWAREF